MGIASIPNINFARRSRTVVSHTFPILLFLLICASPGSRSQFAHYEEELRPISMKLAGKTVRNCCHTKSAVRGVGDHYLRTWQCAIGQFSLTVCVVTVLNGCNSRVLYKEWNKIKDHLLKNSFSIPVYRAFRRSTRKWFEIGMGGMDVLIKVIPCFMMTMEMNGVWNCPCFANINRPGGGG